MPHPRLNRIRTRLTGPATQWRHLALLVSILLLFVATPFAAMFHRGVLLLNAFAVFFLASASYALVAQRRLFTIAVGWSAFTILATGLLLLTESHWAAVLSHGCVVILVGFFSMTILRYVLHGGRVTADRIFAAICVYLLIGDGWTFAYSLVEALQPGSFAPASGQAVAIAPGDYVAQILEMRYFSFMTLTTVGYGDITPHAAAARTLAMLEAVTGQIFLTVLVARLVGLHIVHANKEGP